MSVYVSGLVWRHSRAKGGDLLVLLAIADIAGEDGVARPKWDTSVARLSRMTRLQRRAVQYCLRNLEELGELVVNGPGAGERANSYQILVDPANEVFVGPGRPVDKSENPVAEGAQPSAPQGRNGLRGGAHPVAPDPSDRHTSIPSSRARGTPVDKSGMPQAIADFLSRGITAEQREWARANGWDGLLEQHFEHFREYMSQARNWRRYTDLDAAFRTCVRADWGDVRLQADRARRFGAGANAKVDLTDWWKSSDGVKAKGVTLGVVWEAARYRKIAAERMDARGRTYIPDELPPIAWRIYETEVLDAAVDKEGWGAWVDPKRELQFRSVCLRRAARGADVHAEFKEALNVG